MPISFPLFVPLAFADGVVVDQLERDVQAARVVAGVVDAAVRRLVRHLVGPHVVALPHLDRIEPELVGDDVADPLGQPELLHARVAAVRRHRALVGHDLREVDADVAPAVQAGRDLGPDDAAERLVAREGSAVVERLHLEAQHRAVVLDGDLDVVEPALVPVRIRGVLVGAPLGPLDRPLQLAGEQAAGGQIGVRRDLVPEAAADVLGDEAELVERDAQRRAHPDRRHAGHLVVAVQRELAGAAVVLDQRGRALERGGGEAVEVELLDLHDAVGSLQRAVDIAPVERARPDDVRAGVVVENGAPSSCALRASTITSSGSYSTSTRSAASRARSLRLGDDGDHRLADVADAADRERVVLDLAARRRGQLEERDRSAPPPRPGSACRRRRRAPPRRRRRPRRSTRARTASGRSARSPSRAA